MPIKYTPADFRTIFNSCSIHSYPGASEFKRLLLLSAPPPLIKPKRGHRRGWQVALRHTPPLKQSFPYLISLNSRSLLSKIDDLRDLLDGRLYGNAATILIQEAWLSSPIDSDLVSPTYYQCFRTDRPERKKTRCGGVATYIHEDWCAHPTVTFDYAEDDIECLTLICKPKSNFNFNFKSIVLSNVYIPPHASYSQTSNFFEQFIVSHSHYIKDFQRCVAGANQ